MNSLQIDFERCGVWNFTVRFFADCCGIRVFHFFLKLFNAQMRRTDEQVANEKREAVETLKALREAANVVAANEAEKLRIRREEAKELAGVHLQQAVRSLCA